MKRGCTAAREKGALAGISYGASLLQETSQTGYLIRNGDRERVRNLYNQQLGILHRTGMVEESLGEGCRTEDFTQFDAGFKSCRDQFLRFLEQAG